MERLERVARKVVATMDTAPSVYVGTYAKYNNGDLTGEWVDLTQFSSKEEFLRYCHELHNDESDPEFMFQDYEGFPEEYYSESSIDERIWDYIEKCKEYDQGVVDAILENGDSLDDVDDAIVYPDCVDMTDVAIEMVKQMGGLETLGQETLQNYFDWQSFGRDLGYEGTFIPYDGGYIEIR